MLATVHERWSIQIAGIWIVSGTVSDKANPPGLSTTKHSDLDIHQHLSMTPLPVCGTGVENERHDQFDCRCGTPRARENKPGSSSMLVDP